MEKTALRVLIVDDHLDTCEMMVWAIKRMGYPALGVESGRYLTFTRTLEALPVR